jgi:phosphatidylserine/phosphatidylglycerophosphate/cardiolipin synthase-like enzyme
MAGGASLLRALGAERAVLHDARFFTRTAEGLDEYLRVAMGARQRVAAEMFVATDAPISHTLMRASFRDIGGVAVRDGEYLRLAPGELVPGMPGALRVVDYGDEPFKMHSKSIVADRSHGVVTTAAAAARHREHLSAALDFTAAFRGSAAAALDDATAAAASLRPETIRASLERLAPHGIFVNDPRAGVRLLRARQLGALQGAQERLVIAHKSLYDKDAIALLGQARDRGVRVRVFTPDAPRNASGIARMQALGLDPVLVPAHSLHGNLIIADDQLIASTAMLTPRGLARDRAQRHAREMGFALDDPAALVDAMRALATLA